jgi:hypothetical protein
MILTSTVLLSFIIFLGHSFLYPKIRKRKIRTKLMKISGGGGIIASLY